MKSSAVFEVLPNEGKTLLTGWGAGQELAEYPNVETVCLSFHLVNVVAHTQDAPREWRSLLRVCHLSNLPAKSLRMKL